MTPTEALERSAERILKHIQLNTPNCIVAADVLLLWRAALVYCGDELPRQFGEWMRRRAMTGFALCANCGQPIATEQSFTPVCLACAIKYEEEAKALEAAETVEDES